MTKGRILVTEDDPDSRDMLVLTLQNDGYEVICSTDPANALELANKESFDLILLDNWMPEMDGCSLTREIRKFDQKTPILFYSGAASESDSQTALEAGAQGYLMKPTGVHELIDEVARLILPR